MDMAYIAGFLDGEGCIGVVPVKNYAKNRPLTRTYWTVRITATNNDKAVLEYIASVFGGRVSSHGKRPDGYRPTWRWMLDGKKVDAVLTALLPFLRTKRPQAELALQYRATFDNERKTTLRFVHKAGRFCGVQLDEGIFQRRRKIEQQLAELNHRGRSSL